MGSTVSKSSKSDIAVDSNKGRIVRGFATVGCEKSEIDDDIKRDIIANSNNNNVRKRIRFSALLQQQRNSKSNNVTGGEPSKQNQQPQQQQQKKKKKGKKHNVKSISVKRNAKYKRVTKSIIGKPANFQHMSHIGADQPARMVMHPDDQILAQQLRDITARVNSLMDEAGGRQDQMTIPVSPSTPTPSSTSAFQQQQQQTQIPPPPSSSSSPTTTPIESKQHQHLHQDQFKQSHQQQHHQERKQKQLQRKDVGPPPPPPAHWSSLALRQAMRRQQQMNHHKRLQQLQQQQQQTPQLVTGQKVPSMKRRNVHPSPTAKKMRQQRSAGRRPRANHVSPNALGMPPSLRLGPAR